jgi:HPt (histidine-containing phosphotransfer) domain-containing protein
MAKRDLTGAVDFERLESLTGGYGEAVENLLAAFREQAGRSLRLLDPAASAEVWLEAVRALAASASELGAAALAAACAAAELASLASTAERAFRLDRVRDALDLALADIAAYAHEQALLSLRSRRQDS